MNVSGQRRFRNILIAGLPGVGKSTFARTYAQMSRTEFVELDRYVERIAGRTVSEIFAQDGEAAFRELEAQCLERLLKRQRCTIALGGGTLSYLPSLKLAQEIGCVVLLTAPFDVLMRRLWAERASRPLLADCLSEEELLSRLQKLWQEREESYAQADFQMDTTYSSIDTLKIELDWLEKTYFASFADVQGEASGTPCRQIPVADSNYRSPREQKGSKEISDKMERLLKAQRQKDRGEKRDKREKKIQQPRRSEASSEGARQKLESPKLKNENPRPVAQDGPRPVVQDGPRPVAQDGPRPVAQDGPRPVTQDGPRPVAQDGPRPVAQDGPRPVAQDGPRPVAQDKSRPVAQDAQRPVQSGPIPRSDLKNN